MGNELANNQYYISSNVDGTHPLLYPEYNFREAYQNEEILTFGDSAHSGGEGQFVLSPTIDNIYGFRWPNRVYKVEILDEPVLISAFESFNWGTVGATQIRLIEEIDSKNALGENQVELLKALKFLLSLTNGEKEELKALSQDSLLFLQEKLSFMVQRRLSQEGRRMSSIYSMIIKYRESVELLDPITAITPFLFQALSLREHLDKINGFNQEYYDHACGNYHNYYEKIQAKRALENNLILE